MVAGVERGERGWTSSARVATARSSIRAAQAVGGEAAGDLPQQRQRLVGLAALMEDPRQRHGGVGTGGLQLNRPAQRFLVATGDELVGLGWQQRIKEALDRRRRLRADELGGDLAPSRTP